MNSRLSFLLILGFFYMNADAQTPAIDNYVSLQKASLLSSRYRLSLTSDVDSTWSRWQDRGYVFGFDPKQTPMYTTVDGILSTPYMIQVRGNAEEINRKRWGYHVFEGFARDDRSRITLLLNKHVELKKPVSELYYYGTVYDHSPEAYNWVRIGSDVRQHSYMFSRDRAMFYGSLKLANTLTLGRLGKDDLRQDPPEGDHEQYYEQSAQHVNYQALQESEDGTIFYDRDRDLIVIKIGGEWMQMMVKPLPEGVSYDE